MTILGIFILSIAFLLIIYSIKNELFIFSFALILIVLLGIIQLEIINIYNSENLDEFINFDVTEESIYNAQLAFLWIILSSIIFMPKREFKNIKSPCNKINSKQGILINISTITLITLSIYFANDEINPGRPMFSGMGIFLGLLLPFSMALLTLTKNKIHRLIGVAGFFTILHFSRLLFLIGAISIILYNLEIEKIKFRSIIKIISIGFLLALTYFINGQIKHLIGQGYNFIDALKSSYLIQKWLFEDNINLANLSIVSNFILGIELGAEVADCLHNNKFNIHNILGTANDILSGSIPSFVRQYFIDEIHEYDCNIAIVKSPIVDLIRAFGFNSILIYIPILWYFVRYCEIMKNKKTDNLSILLYSTLGVFSIFLIRGSINAFVSFSIALLLGFIFINLCSLRFKSK